MTRTVRRTGLPLILCIILAAILTANASAFVIKLGPIREQTIRWLMESKHLSRPAAEQMMRDFARRNRADIIDEYEIPDGAIADFVSIDPTRPGAEKVQREGCAMLFSPGSDYGKWYWSQLQKLRGTPNYDYFMQRFGAAVKAGVFAHGLTDEQRDRLLNAGRGEGLDGTKAATPIRVLVVSVRMPPWSDQANSTSYISHGHPIHPPIPPGTPGEITQIYTTGMTPGGAWANGQREGLTDPAWNEQHEGHDDPTNGPDSFVYRLRTDFVEHWYSFMYDYSNPYSVANWFRDNSHGNIAINGDRGDIAAWLDSHHVLDVNPFGQNRDWTPMPATPLIRDITGGPEIARASVTTNAVSVLFRDHFTVQTLGGNGPQANPANYQITLPAGTAPDTPPYRITGNVQVDQFDTRHVTFTDAHFQYLDANGNWTDTTTADGEPYTLTYTPTGATASGLVNRGCAGLPNTTVTAAEATTWLLQKRAGNRLMSLCYYTHDHDFTVKSGRPYQLAHCRDASGDIDDIMGSEQSNLNDHIDRPAPYDHDFWDDANLATGGYFGQDAGHTTGDWIGDVNAVMGDWGISGAGYDRVIYTHPAGPAVDFDDRFIPMAPPVVLPEDAGLGVTCHEMMHSFGAVDLYDNDFYANNTPPPPDPPYFESDAAGPYSIMGNGGMRLDPWHKIALGWLTPTPLAQLVGGTWQPQDRVNAALPEIETPLSNAVVYEALPELATRVPTGDGNPLSPYAGEYFLIENRNRNGANFYGDSSPRGMYVWHIDTRFTQEDEIYFAVICEQADGLYELERNPRGSHGSMEGDPFPGSLGVREFTQWTNPNSRTHGIPAGRGQVVPGSAHDSYFRVDQISNPSANMTANFWVQPHEIVATTYPVVNTPDPLYPRALTEAFQGETDVEVLGLNLDNDDGTRDANNISQGDVIIRELLVDEAGSSPNDTDVSRALVYEDKNGDGEVQPGSDVLLATAPVTSQLIRFTGMSYRIPVGGQARLLVAYDIANNAQISPSVTLGAGIDHADPNYDSSRPWSCVTCQVPGVVQERVRNAAGPFGAARFPLRSPTDRVYILEAPDTLTITPTNLAPPTAIQGTLDVEMLGLRLRVNRDEVIIDGVKIDSVGTSTRAGDVLAKLYYDQNINGIIDGADSVLDTASFTLVGGVPTAIFDDLGNYTVVEGTDRGLIVAYDYAPDAGDPPAVPPVTVNARLLDPSYVTLRPPAAPSPPDVVAPTNFLPAPTGMRSSDTEILRNTPPTLTDYQGNVPVQPDGEFWVVPTDGNPTTNFRWEAIYTDAENQPPATLQVVLDSVPYNMQPVNPGDTDYTNGASFRYQTTLPVGNHVYYIVCSDGKNNLRFPATAPETYPHPVVTNPPPTLSVVPGEVDYWSPKQTIPPDDGTPRTTFTWRVIYTDVESEPPNPIQVWIDGASHAMVAANPGDTDYTDGAEFTYATQLPVGIHSYYLFASDGTNNVRIPTTAPDTLPGPRVVDPPCTLTDSTGTPPPASQQWLTPITGTPQTNFTWTAIYTDPESVPPSAIEVWIDGTARTMTPVNPADTDYTDGALFRYQTTLPVGNHSYFMQANDGNNTVRWPAVGSYPDPTVTDDPCLLVDHTGVPGSEEWVQPQDGTPQTTFVWEATYFDPENLPPSSILVTLDGTGHAMNPVNPADQDYTDGVTYRYQTQLPVGNHAYFISCSDGTNPLRFPAAGTYPHPVVTDPAFTLTDNQGGTTDWLAPTTGTPRTTFVWEAIYTDPESVPPATIEVTIDGTAHPMTQVNPADQDYSDGALFRYQTTLALGTHSYFIFADDGNNTLRFPTTGTYPNPTVTDPPCTLTDTATPPGTTAWLTPTVGTPQTNFTWTAIYTDPESIPPAFIQVVLDGVPQAMVQTNPADTDYTDGAIFRFQTTLPKGNHAYYITANDGVNTVRFPTAGTYPDPTVNDALCTLVDHTGTPPPASEEWVLPATGSPLTTFVWEATYTDPENQPPTYILVTLDGTPQAMTPVNPADQDYTNGALFRFQTTGLPVGNHSYFMSCSDGSNPLRYPTTTTPPGNVYPLLVADPLCQLTDNQGTQDQWLSPLVGNSTTVFTWEAIYSDPEGVAPVRLEVTIDGVPHALAQVDPTDLDYTDGALFRYQTTLAVGTHSYFMFVDDGNNTLRFPATGEYEDAPVVSDLPFTVTATDGGVRNWLSPLAGFTTTMFTWNAIWTDSRNLPPTFLRIVLDGTAHGMWPVNPADTDYTDGALFRYQAIGLTVATHSYYVSASDGTNVVRYPTAAPTTYPEPVVANRPPVLSNASVNPTSGDDTTVFTYSITYTDLDGHLPAFMRISKDGAGWLDMVEQDPLDTDPTDGKVYTHQTGFIGAGPHTARFQTNDGFDTVDYPVPGPFTGPVLVSASTAFFADKTYAPYAGSYEEGEKVFVQLTDLDKNADVTARDVVNVTFTVLTGGDTETVQLWETQANTGIFRSGTGIPTLGRAGVSGDGVINVAAGPLPGNRLQFEYDDPDPNDPTDRQLLTARIIDTRSPKIITLPELVARSNVDGSQVDVDFTAYDEAAQIDVDHYEVFFETAPAPIGTLTPAVTLPAGTQTTTLPTGGPGVDRFVAVAVHDEAGNVDANVKWRKVNTDDKNPPQLLNETPANGTTDVARNTNISFDIYDDGGSGIQAAGIRVRIQENPADGGRWRDVTPGLNITGNQVTRNVTYDPPVDFRYNQRVVVEVTATDNAGNRSKSTFEFFTVTDVEPPAFQNADPANGDTDVPINTNLEFELTDNLSGVDPNTIRVTVNGTNVSTNLQIGGTPLLTTVLYDPPTDFAWGSTVTVTVDASDVAGNAMSTVIYSFTIRPDNQGIVIDQLSPANRAVDVPRDARISFRVSDTLSGVDQASVQLLIDGVQVALKPANFTALSPTSYQVTYNPGRWEYAQSVKVRASARDKAGNKRVGVTWSFTTEAAPTYSITGTIRETIPNAGAAVVGVAGVNVKITDVATGQVVMTVQSAGTGVYQATGLPDGTYVVEPTLTDYTFRTVVGNKPTARVYVGAQDKNGDGNPDLDAVGVDFNATRQLYEIRGQVLENGVGLEGVQVTDGTRTATTGPSGAYVIADVPSGTYTVVPTKTNYTFNPTARTAVVASANATGVDFTAAARTFSISGTVADSEGNRLAGVKVEVQGGTSVAVTNQAGLYTLTGVKAGLRTIVATRDGYLFEPAPGVVLDNLNVSSDLTGINIVGYPVLSRTFTAGTHFIGVPLTPRTDDAAQVFGTTDVARWAGTSSPPHYVTVATNPGHDALRVQPGAGFFVRFGAATRLAVAGAPVSNTAPYIFAVDAGWTMAANPFTSAIGFANLRPNIANTLAPYGFVLGPSGYVLVSSVPALGGRSYIDGWEGVWLQSNLQGATITAMPPGTATAGVPEAVQRVVDGQNWRIPIVARAAGTTDACTTVGVSAATGALSAVNPPTLPDTVDVVLKGTAGAALAADLKAQVGNGVAWDFSVIAPAPNTAVELTLPDLSEVPATLNVTLVDVAAGKRMAARMLPSYTYDSGQGGARQFRLEVAPRTTAGLTLRATGVQPNPAAVAVSYVVSADAAITADILNLAGRKVATLARGGNVSAGTNTLSWNLTSENGTKVPAGRYLVRLEATTADGQRASAVQSILVNR